MLDRTADGVANDPAATATATLAALRSIAHSGPTVYLPSHDPHSQARLATLTEAPRDRAAARTASGVVVTA